MPRGILSWRLRHPFRFARTRLPLLMPLSWRSRLIQWVHGNRARAWRWGSPADWSRELHPMPQEMPAPGDSEPLVSIHVIAHGNLEMTRLCLDSIRRLTDYQNYELVVLDNGSDDGTAEWLRQIADPPRLRISVQDENRGFAVACNEAVRLSKGAVICLLNNDVVVSRGWLRCLVDELLHNDEAGLVGPVTNSVANEARIAVRYRSFTSMLDLADRRRNTHARQAFRIPVLALYCAVLWRRVWEDVGPLDERFGIGMFEDDDYARRLKQRGYSLVCREDAFVHHWGRAAFRLLGDERYFEIYRANRDAFRKKWERSRAS